MAVVPVMVMAVKVRWPCVPTVKVSVLVVVKVLVSVPLQVFGDDGGEGASASGGVCNASMEGQLLLTTVVAADTVPYVIGGSFCMNSRNCALDVC